LETTSTTNNQKSLRAQVASSKGNEWMVSSYNTWQQRSPLASEYQKNISPMMQLVSSMTPVESFVKTAISQSFRVIVLILGLILIVKSR